MNQLPTNLVELAAAKTNVDVHVHRGERVSNVFRNASTGKWNMLGTTGAAAYHDTKEEVARMAQVNSLASGTSYHAVVLTDVSSSFGAWHRASAGVPEEFARRVRERAGSRVPLFTTMVTFEQSLGVSESAVAMVRSIKIFLRFFRTKFTEANIINSYNGLLKCHTRVSSHTILSCLSERSNFVVCGEDISQARARGMRGQLGRGIVDVGIVAKVRHQADRGDSDADARWRIHPANQRLSPSGPWHSDGPRIRRVTPRRENAATVGITPTSKRPQDRVLGCTAMGQWAEGSPCSGRTRLAHA